MQLSTSLRAVISLFKTLSCEQEKEKESKDHHQGSDDQSGNCNKGSSKFTSPKYRLSLFLNVLHFESYK